MGLKNVALDSRGGIHRSGKRGII